VHSFSTPARVAIHFNAFLARRALAAFGGCSLKERLIASTARIASVRRQGMLRRDYLRRKIKRAPVVRIMALGCAYLPPCGGNCLPCSFFDRWRPLVLKRVPYHCLAMHPATQCWRALAADLHRSCLTFRLGTVPSPRQFYSGYS